MENLPKLASGQVDVELIKKMYMESPLLAWTHFAEKQGWHVMRSRQVLPIAIWQQEKRNNIAIVKMDVLNSLAFENKFLWTEEVLKTLNNHLPAIDMALQITKAKLSQYADWYKDYTENFRGKQDQMYYKNRRRYHPFEKLSGIEIASINKGIRELTEARVRALMLDKWSISKFDMPLDEPPSSDNEGESKGPFMTLEGKQEITPDLLRGLWEKYHDKPIEKPPEPTEKAEDGSSST